MSFLHPSTIDKAAAAKEAMLAVAHLAASPKCPLCRGTGTRLVKPKGKGTSIQSVICSCVENRQKGIARI